MFYSATSRRPDGRAQPHPRHPFQMRTLLCSLLVVAAAGFTGTPVPQDSRQGGARQYDIVIGNGRIVDGTGNAWFYGDVAISGDRIARVTPAGMLRDAPARQRIEARGLVIAPGVIDIQAQSYPELLTTR